MRYDDGNQEVIMRRLAPSLWLLVSLLVLVCALPVKAEDDIANRARGAQGPGLRLIRAARGGDRLDSRKPAGLPTTRRSACACG
jgi:hypothetical protein